MIEEKHWLSKLQTLSPTEIASVYPFLRSHSYCTNLFTWTKVYSLIVPSALRITCIVLVSRLQKSPRNLCWWVFRKPELRRLARLWLFCSNGALISESVRWSLLTYLLRLIGIQRWLVLWQDLESFWRRLMECLRTIFFYLEGPWCVGQLLIALQAAEFLLESSLVGQM